MCMSVLPAYSLCLIINIHDANISSPSFLSIHKHASPHCTMNTSRNETRPRQMCSLKTTLTSKATVVAVAARPAVAGAA